MTARLAAEIFGAHRTCAGYPSLVIRSSGRRKNFVGSDQSLLFPQRSSGSDFHGAVSHFIKCVITSILLSLGPPSSFRFRITLRVSGAARPRTFKRALAQYSSFGISPICPRKARRLLAGSHDLVELIEEPAGEKRGIGPRLRGECFCAFRVGHKDARAPLSTRHQGRDETVSREFSGDMTNTPRCGHLVL